MTKQSAEFSPQVRTAARCRTTVSAMVAFVTLNVLLTVPVRAQDDELPKIDEMMQQIPSFKDLMDAADSGDEVDWIVLKDDRVIVSTPVYPRPDTLKKIEAERTKLEGQRGGSREERTARRNRLEQLRKLTLSLPENQAEDLLLPLNQVQKVISFERLMLWRVDELLDQGEIARAYQMMLVVDRRAPNWEESTPRFDNLLITEAQLKLDENEPYAALALMDELAQRNLANEQLPVLMGRTIDGLVADAIAADQYNKGQYLLKRLSRYFPQHSVVSKWTTQLRGKSLEYLTEARRLADSGEHRSAADAAREARRIWADLSSNEIAEVSRYLSRYQTLRVAVRRFSGEQNVSPVPQSAELRHENLTTVSLFEAASADELTYYQSSFFDIWDPTDLGREVVFTLKETRPYFRSQPVLTANQVAGALNNLLNPDLPSFNPRLASFVKAFSVRSPRELNISFNRVPMNLEALFRFPVDSEVTLQNDSADLLSTRFQLADNQPQQRIYRRVVPEPDGLIPTQYHVAEIIETKYTDRHDEIQAFRRREVDVLPELRPWEIDIFKGSGLAFVQQYAIPRTDVIVFNPYSETVRSAQLRRGLSFGVDRENLLKKVILRDPEMKYGRPASAPWRSGSYANSPLVDPPTYDLYLSYLLRLAAREQLRVPVKQQFVADAKAAALAAKEDWDEEAFRIDNAAQIRACAADIELPRLRMICPSDEVSMLAAEQLIKRWRLLEYDIELIPSDSPGDKLGDDDWDLMYRTVRMQEPLLDLWGLMLTDDKFDVDRLSGYPDWMRQELINLDYATSFKDAETRLFRIHRQIAAQAFIIPLWELDSYIALQRNIAGFAARPLSVYQDIERWLVKP
ncbi:MAG: ABC transporter substrate-binding protein [Planctomycetaceae bacterium]|nr:ABC transporter substrate-binding protein [Planctomycetaceae bacterium]